MKAFVPKPPPTSLVTTRSLSGGIFRITSARSVWTTVSPWLPSCSVNRSAAASYSATRAARLHVIGDEALVDDFDPRHMRGLGEDGVGLGLVADMRRHRRRCRARRRKPEPRRAEWPPHIDDRRQRLPVDGSASAASRALARRVRDDHRDDIADMMNRIARHHRIGLAGIIEPSEFVNLARQGNPPSAAKSLAT